MPKVKIGLIFRAVPSIACAAPIRPPRRRYSRVSRANQISSRSRAWRTASTTAPSPAPCSAERAAATTRQPRPPAPVWLSTTSMRPGCPSLARERAASVALSHVPEMPAAMWTETTSRPAADERLVAGAKIPHRRLRSRRQRRGLAQPRVEGIEVVVLILGPKVTIPAHVQADLENPPAVDQLPRQIGRAVGHHGDSWPPTGCSDVSGGAHARAKPTATPAEAGIQLEWVCAPSLTTMARGGLRGSQAPKRRRLRGGGNVGRGREQALRCCSIGPIASRLVH